MYKLVNYFIKYNDENLDPTKEFFFSLESPIMKVLLF